MFPSINSPPQLGAGILVVLLCFGTEVIGVMAVALILRAFLLSAMLCRVYSFPAKGYYGHQPLPQLGQMETGWPSSSSTDVQQSGPPPPQTPGLYTQSGQGVSPMTFSAEVKGSMPQTSSGYEKFEAAPVAFGSNEPLEGRFYSPASVKGVPQASPMEPLPVPVDAYLYTSSVSEPESQMLFDPQPPNPEILVIASPMEPLPVPVDAYPYTSWVSEPESQMLFVPQQPNPEILVIASPPPPPEAALPVFDPHFNYWWQPSYKAGTLIQRGATYEHGNEESESHDSGYLQPPPPLRAFSENRVPDSNEPLESQFYSPAPVQGVNGVPEPSSYVSPPQELYDDRFFDMFITGQLPPGTVTHFSSTDDHGSNAWTDISFERIPPPPYRKAPGGLSKVRYVSKINTKVPQGFSPPPRTPWKFTAEAPLKRAWW
ncbi:extensin-2-like [Clupea harengus]|uniref:Extensin-2-like n=1 Tax=Clupea harengus TaxID=7950 RepID=A0A6P8ERG0_CLUHA|nr:extensin-2-like [Clupea harengus]